MSSSNNKKDGKKYIVILMDGAADYPVDSLGKKTPLGAAKKPFTDLLAQRGITGMVNTVPKDTSPGSDTANLSILGYDPVKYSTGRSSLEAVSIGVKLEDDDIVFRCNLVTLSEEPEYRYKTMIDYSAGEISTEEAKVLITEVAKLLERPDLKFYTGVSYRHIMVLKNQGPHENLTPDTEKNGSLKNEDLYILTPPHDISGRKIYDYLPAGKKGAILLKLMEESARILAENPLNIKRINSGKRPANSIWFWAKATKPLLPSFYKKYALKGSVISAVDLVKGIGICAGLNVVNVTGATGNINTNYEGKAFAALEELSRGQDFVYIHIEAPDECGHQGNAADKIKAIELIDEKVVGIIKSELEEKGVPYSIMILPDHPTPVCLKTHTIDPVPFLIYDSSSSSENKKAVFDESFPASTGLKINEGHKLMDYFLNYRSGLNNE
ncbi:MAG: cofactor-independent phosphoglycerate mutase [Actinobacteria bacterium]|nr:cofactor-independent phosphoglycerate mutase [Actinomycetota bacterium]